jgi:UDP-N-acetylglucosamine--N-acetylmuramyl-(pentapeptide) pyrophosphoryl-undecaprenol N-acetylglucosamine transferase
MNKVLCVVAGGSGGHIIPGITYTSHQRREGETVLLFSTKGSLDAAIVNKFPFIGSTVPLDVDQLPGKKFWRYPAFLYRLVKAFFKSYRVLKATRPASVLSMGGLVSVPVCLAAWTLGIPITLFELNAVPGKAVRWLAPLATRIAVCFEKAGISFDPTKVSVVEYPLRFTEQHKLSKHEAEKKIDKKMILVLGGSQGSRAINDLMVRLFRQYPEFASQVTVVHQVGVSKIKEQTALEYYREFYLHEGIEGFFFDFIPDLHPYYCAADVVIGRAGAGTLFELAFFEKKSLLMPLEKSAEGHQLENALAMIQKRPDLFSLVRQPHSEDNIAVLYQALVKSLAEPK